MYYSHNVNARHIGAASSVNSLEIFIKYSGFGGGCGEEISASARRERGMGRALFVLTTGQQCEVGCCARGLLIGQGRGQYFQPSSLIRVITI